MILTSCLSPAVSSQTPNPPGNLHVEVTIQQGTTASASASLSVKFFDAEGHFIEFAAGETIACNNTFLAFHDDALLGLHVDSYEGQISIPPIGGSYTCVYRIPGGTKASIVVPSRRSLVLLSPANGAQIKVPTKTHTLTITYVSANGQTISGSAQDSMEHVADGTVEQDSGIYTLDDSSFSAFAPGAGAISLTRKWTFAPPGTGFQSVDVTYDLTSTAQVTWV